MSGDGGAVILRRGRVRLALDPEVPREVVARGELTPVPGAPAEVRGLVQVRGQVIPVLDPAPDQPDAGGAAPGLLLLIEGRVRGERIRVALLADALEEDGEPGEPAPSSLRIDELLAETGRRVAAAWGA